MTDRTETAADAGLRPKERRRPPPQSLANLRPWRRGQSGNPSGLRDRAILAKAAGKHVPRAVERVSELLDHPDPTIRLKAAAWLSRQAFGDPPSSQTVLQPAATVNISQHIGGPALISDAATIVSSYTEIMGGDRDARSVTYAPQTPQEPRSSERVHDIVDAEIASPTPSAVVTPDSGTESQA